jgi:hypothetical protein
MEVNNNLKAQKLWMKEMMRSLGYNLILNLVKEVFLLPGK